MLNLRTFTIGTPFEFDKEKISKLKKTAEKHFDPRTYRINLPIYRPYSGDTFSNKLNEIDGFCEEQGIRWYCLPFNLLNTNIPSDFVKDIISVHNKAFVNLIVSMDNLLSYDSVIRASKTIRSVSSINGGIENFRLGVSCNPSINTPFFPFTYSSMELGFSIGLELIPIIDEIIERNESNDISKIREDIIDTIVPQLKELEKICYDIENGTGAKYHGIDLSIAPFPNESNSVGNLLVSLGLDSFGSNGTLFFTSFFTDVLKHIAKESSIRSVGFNGVMYSLMEDTSLSRCSSMHIFSIDSLISYSSVCGCGLDMVPIPGHTYVEEIASIILDISSLSTVLSKPLGVRVLPIPDKWGGEITEFDHDFIQNTRIKNIKNVVLWNDSFKNKFFSYKKYTPRIDGTDIKEFWDRRASYHSEDEGLTNLEEDKELLKLKVENEKKRIFKYFDPTHKSILDLGGGNGNWAFLFSNTAKDVTVVDYCRELINQGTRRAIRNDVQNITFFEDDVREFLPEKKFDVVFISGVLLYLNDDELENVINNIDKITEIDSELIIRDATGISGRYCINKKYSKKLKAHYSAIYRTREEYISAFSKIGFELVDDTDMFDEGSPLNMHEETRLRLYKFRKIR